MYNKKHRLSWNRENIKRKYARNLKNRKVLTKIIRATLELQEIGDFTP